MTSDLTLLWAAVPGNGLLMAHHVSLLVEAVASRLRLAAGILSILFAVSACIAVSACNSIGPDTVPRDRADYAAALGDSWKQQTLLNIVKLRYGDFPVFMEIAQVIAGYQLQTTVAAGFSARTT